MSLAADLVQIADERIRLNNKATALMGTVVTRDSTGPGAMVLFDGSTVAVPVKCMGHVHCRPADRVSLSRWGSDWLIVGSFSGPGFGEASLGLEGLPTATGGLTSATFVDLNEFGTFPFTKFYDNTFIRMGLTFGGYPTGSAARAQWALRLTPTAGGIGYIPQDYKIGSMLFNLTTLHLYGYGHARVLGVPAGTYTVSVRWRRVSGTGAVVSDTSDGYAAELDERVRAGSPYL